MERFISSVEQALKDENWHAALTVALILPDVCGALENPQLKSKERYVAWFDRYAAPRFHQLPKINIPLTGEECYLLRCALLHAGTEEVSDTKLKTVLGRFHFFAPKRNWTFSGHHVRDIIQLPVDRFCTDICEGVKQWAWEVLQQQKEVKARSEGLLIIRHIDDDGIALT